MCCSARFLWESQNQLASSSLGIWRKASDPSDRRPLVERGRADITRLGSAAAQRCFLFVHTCHSACCHPRRFQKLGKASLTVLFAPIIIQKRATPNLGVPRESYTPLSTPQSNNFCSKSFELHTKAKLYNQNLYGIFVQENMPTVKGLWNCFMLIEHQKLHAEAAKDLSIWYFHLSRGSYMFCLERVDTNDVMDGEEAAMTVLNWCCFCLWASRFSLSPAPCAFTCSTCLQGPNSTILQHLASERFFSTRRPTALWLKLC